MRLYYQALRAPTLLTSVVPAAAGGVAAIGVAGADWWLMAVALLALLLVHAGTNISNDVEDAARGVDPPDKVRRNSAVFNTGRLSIAHGRRLYGTCFLVAVALGIVIAAVQGPALLAIGVVGVLGGLLYTAGPVPYKYLGLGDPLIVLLMGPLMTQGVYTAVTGDPFAARGFWAGIGPGLLIACVLASNNIDDLDSDAAAGARTLQVRIGFDRARVLYAATLLATVPAQLALWIAGVFGPWALLPLALTGLLVLRAREVLVVRDRASAYWETLTPRTAQLHLLFSALLVVGIALDRAL